MSVCAHYVSGSTRVCHVGPRAYGVWSELGLSLIPNRRVGLLVPVAQQGILNAQSVYE